MNIVAQQTQSSGPTSIAMVKRAIEAEAAPSGNSILEASPEAEVLVLDVFSAQPSHEPWHGDSVVSIIENGGVESKKLLKVDNRNGNESNRLLSDLTWKTGPESMEDRVDAYIELSAAHLLMKTNGKLQSILDTPDLKLKVVNQSQGKSRADIYALLADNIFDTTKLGPDNQPIPSALGENLAKVLDVESATPEKWGREMKQKLINRVDQVVDNSALVSQVQSQHSSLLSELGERGVLVVASAGNNADELAGLRNQGYQVPDDFDDDITAVGNKLVVGALDPGPTSSPLDDQIAFFSSDYAGVNVYANGVNVPTVGGLSTGTSYAAPQVTASVHKLALEHPDWSSEQISSAIKAEYRFVPEG